MSDEERFLAIITADPTVHAVLERAPALGVGDWWLAAGVLFQTVWNAVTGRPVRATPAVPGAAERSATWESAGVSRCCSVAWAA